MGYSHFGGNDVKSTIRHMPNLTKFLKRLFVPSRVRDAAIALYSAAVRQARSAELYENFDVPDTLDGRFDMVVLHVYLLLERLSRSGEACTDLQMMLQEALFADLDRSLREMGVGDLSVGKHVKKMASAYFGRLKAYDDALHDKDEKLLVDALERNVWRGAIEDRIKAKQLAEYVRQQYAHLEAQSAEDLCSGKINFLQASIKETSS